jgi:hypothetical protein
MPLVGVKDGVRTGAGGRITWRSSSLNIHYTKLCLVGKEDDRLWGHSSLPGWLERSGRCGGQWHQRNMTR